MGDDLRGPLDADLKKEGDEDREMPIASCGLYSTLTSISIYTFERNGKRRPLKLSSAAASELWPGLPVQIFRDIEDPRAMHYADCKTEWIQAISEGAPGMPEIHDLEFKFLVMAGEYGVDAFDVTPMGEPSFPFSSPRPKSRARRIARCLRRFLEVFPNAVWGIERRL
jgi:hypothetical protein